MKIIVVSIFNTWNGKNKHSFTLFPFRDFFEAFQNALDESFKEARKLFQFEEEKRLLEKEREEQQRSAVRG